MQRIIFEDPYEFLPPYRGVWFPAMVRDSFLPRLWLWWNQGLDSIEFRNPELLRESIDAGHGVVIAPNHVRLS